MFRYGSQISITLSHFPTNHAFFDSFQPYSWQYPESKPLSIDGHPKETKHNHDHLNDFKTLPITSINDHLKYKPNDLITWNICSEIYATCSRLERGNTVRGLGHHRLWLAQSCHCLAMMLSSSSLFFSSISLTLHSLHALLHMKNEKIMSLCN